MNTIGLSSQYPTHETTLVSGRSGNQERRPKHGENGHPSRKRRGVIKRNNRIDNERKTSHCQPLSPWPQACIESRTCQTNHAANGKLPNTRRQEKEGKVLMVARGSYA